MSDSESDEEIKLDEKGRPVESSDSEEEEEEESGDEKKPPSWMEDVKEYEPDEKKHKRKKRFASSKKDKEKPVHAYMSAPQLHVYYPDYKKLTVHKFKTKSRVFPTLYISVKADWKNMGKKDTKDFITVLKSTDEYPKVAAFAIYKQGDDTMVESVEMWNGHVSCVQWRFTPGQSVEFKVVVNYTEIRAKKFLESKMIDTDDGKLVYQYKDSSPVR